jgi:dipeptidyl aminopeptidase/acylaminoacyl peptidase
VKRELERIEIPGEAGARARAWNVVQSAFVEREPVERPPRRLWPVAAVAVVLALVAAAVSSPGQAVIDQLREVVAKEAAAPLFRIPAAGRLLVVSQEHGGLWVVDEDGSRRRLGDYDDAQWSPFGRYIVATRRNLLRALTPEGEERWSISGRGVSQATWSGSQVDTRLAYVSTSGIRVVAGDGNDDRLLVPGADGPLAFRPGSRHELAYPLRNDLVLRNVDTGDVIWRARGAAPRSTQVISWSSDGRRVAVVARRAVTVLDDRGGVVRRLEFPGRDVVTAAFAPRGHELAVHLRDTSGGYLGWRSILRVQDVDRRARGKAVFSGQGDFGELAWSPDGRWLLLTWRTSDQWLFVDRTTGRIVAIPEVSRRFPRPDGGRPLLFVSGRWCCER